MGSTEASLFIRTTLTGNPEINAKVICATIYVGSRFIIKGLIMSFLLTTVNEFLRLNLTTVSRTATTLRNVDKIIAFLVYFMFAVRIRYPV